MPLSRRDALAASLFPLVGYRSSIRRSSTDGNEDRRSITGSASIGFAGDLQFGRSVSDYREDRPPESVWGSMLEPLRSLDGLFGNLECAISTRGEKWPDKRFHFRADPGWTLPALEAAGTSGLSLANNHAMDFGEIALEDTLCHLSSIDVATVGAGMDLEAATAPALVEIGEVEVATFGFVDHWEEFGAVSDGPGTAYVEMSVDDPETRRVVGDTLERARDADPDLIVASLHWGSNYELTKSEGHREFGRWLIDRGVDVVHGHSAHVVQGVEVYRGRPIVYDAGDFVNDYADREGYHNDRSFLFELTVDDGFEALRLVPSEIENYRVDRAGDEAEAWLHEQIRDLSAEFDTPIEAEDDGSTLRIPLGDEDEDDA